MDDEDHPEISLVRAWQSAGSRAHSRMKAVGFEPTQLALEEFESTSLDPASQGVLVLPESRKKGSRLAL